MKLRCEVQNWKIKKNGNLIKIITTTRERIEHWVETGQYYILKVEGTTYHVNDEFILTEN